MSEFEVGGVRTTRGILVDFCEYLQSVGIIPTLDATSKEQLEALIDEFLELDKNG